MKLIGLTGGVGMGKTTAAELLADRGIPVVDTDAIAHKLVEAGQPALAEIRRSFGDHLLTPEGRLRRDQLAELVFSDPQARARLEAILHPQIRESWLAQVTTWRQESHPLAVVVIPLLFETEAARSFDATVCVACSAATQKARLAARGWSDAQMQARIQAQWPIEKKMAAADFVVWNEGALEIQAQQLSRILENI